MSLFSQSVQRMLLDESDAETDESWFSSLGGNHSWTEFQKLQFMDMRTRLPQSIVHHLDRTTMAHSVEARVPFLDHVFVEFCNSLPEKMKLSGLKEKAILRQAMSTLLPKDITRRRKRAMTAPCDHWFRTQLTEFAGEFMSEQAIRAKDYFNPKTVQRLLKIHRRKERNYGSILLGVLGMQLWDEMFLKKNYHLMTTL